MKKHLYLYIALLFAGFNTHAQFYITGVVRDSLTNTPLEGASIVLDYNKSRNGTKTDADGKFVLTVSRGNHTLNVRYVGYVSSSKFIASQQSNLNIDFSLTRVENELEQVVVTTKGFDQNVRQPLLGVNQINIKTFQKLPSAFGELDLLRGMQMLPGVTSVGEASNGVNIRGGTTDQNLILLDDTPIFNPTHMFGLFSVFPPDAVTNLDLYKGNVPGRYGGRAASVVDITLKNPNLEKFMIKGGVSLVSNRLMIEAPIVKDKVGIYFAGRAAFNDFLLPIASDRLNDIRTKFGEGVFKGFWKMNTKNTLTAMYYKSYDNFQTNLLTNLPNVIGVSTFYKHYTNNGMMRWLHVINPKLNLQTTALVAQYSPKIINVEKTANEVSLASNLLQKQIKSNINYQLSKHKIESGLSFIQYTIKPGTLNPNGSESVKYITTPTEYANEAGWYADDEYEISKKLAVSIGIRYSRFMAMGPNNYRTYIASEPRDDYSVLDTFQVAKGSVMKAYGGFEPRFGLRYNLSENASLKFGYNLMRQYLQIVSNTTTPIPTSRWKTSDQHIKPQISSLISMGYYQSFNDNIYDVSLEGYYRFTENIVDYKPGADFLLSSYPETQLLQGKNRSYGLEVMFSKKKGETTGWINYTYSRSMNKVNEGSGFGEQINFGNWYAANYDRPHSFNASLIINQGTHHDFSFNFSYSTGRPYTLPEGFVVYQGRSYPFFGVRNNARL
ncbi:MAG: TonB-dependent receptor, partial [Emticicia sp.]